MLGKKPHKNEVYFSPPTKKNYFTPLHVRMWM